MRRVGARRGEQRLGKAEEARRWLGKARAWLDQYGDEMPVRAEEEFRLHLHNWLEAHVLRREAEALILPIRRLRARVPSPSLNRSPQRTEKSRNSAPDSWGIWHSHSMEG
jgi:hypothetical protein